jgi:hypothetical protein
MSDATLGFVFVGVLLVFIVGASIYLRLTRDHPDVSDEAVRRARAHDEGNWGKDPNLYNNVPPGL